MLMALRFEPSRFFLKGKVTQKQTSYRHLSYSVFMFVACLFLCHFAFEKEPAKVLGSKRKAINIYFAFIL